MSFIFDAVRPGTNALHITNSLSGQPQRRLRKSRTYGDLVAPITRVVLDRIGSLGEILETFTLEENPRKRRKSEDGESRRQVLYLRMKEASTYEDWRATATELDILDGNEEWKQQNESPEYNGSVVEAHLKSLEEARISCDLNRISFLIRTSLTRGLGGMGDLRLYRHSNIGTKALIEKYIESVKETLHLLVDLSCRNPEAKTHVYEEVLRARQAFGRSALLLSGGGTFGMNHIGVVKTLWQHKLLPRIVSGSSAGSIVCAVLCTKTDAEVPDVLHDFCNGDLAVFEKEDSEESMLQKAARFLKFGAIFDISNLTRVLQSLLGDLTFQEAYNRTRRILNISVSSASIHELPRLLNHITAPNVIIWSAVAASCSVPFVFSPASLLAKDPKTGEFVPWNPSPHRWIDGSVDNDLPMTRLAEMFNVNHFIVSQVNPHVVPFLVKEEGVIASASKLSSSAFAPGPDWLHKMANLAKGEALHRMHVLAEMGVFPNGFTKLRSVLSQKYSGDITILPEISYANLPKVLQNPTPDFMHQATLSGERATWPKLSRIQNHCAIELALDDTVQQLRSKIVFSPSQVDLRLGSLTMSSTKHGVAERRGRSRNTGHARHRPSSSLEPESSHSPPQRPRSYFEVRPKEPLAPSLQHKNHLSLELPGSPAVKVAAADLLSSSADEEHPDVNPFSEDTDESSQSYSDASPPIEISRPTLWPTTRQLFPSATAPNTPFLTSRFSRSSAILQSPQTPAIAPMTSMANGTSTTETRNSPSSPELRYKRLFHGQARIVNTDGASEMSPQNRRRSVVEFTTVNGDYDEDDEESVKPGGSRGTNTPLVLDISGTRGMMLRRKRSSSTGMKGVMPPVPR